MTIMMFLSCLINDADTHVMIRIMTIFIRSRNVTFLLTCNRTVYDEENSQE